jgi:type III secretion protein K
MADAPAPAELASLQARMLGTERDRYARLHDFNFLPSRSLHPSWHAALFPPEALPLLARSGELDARVHRWLSAYLLQQPRLAQAGFWEPTPALSLALLAPVAMLELARRVGTALASATLRHLLAGRTAAETRLALGPELHDFALQRAPLLVTRAESEAMAGQGGRIEVEGLGAAVEKLGAGALRAAWDEEPGLWSRASLKLPQTLADSAEAAPRLQPAACARLALRIARESIPQWHTYSASAAA